MGLALKIINSLLIIFAVYMGIRQGSAMVAGKDEMLEMFGKWGINRQGVMVFGLFTLLSAALILIPKTFIWGNFMMAASILLIICLHLSEKDMKGVVTELPYFLLSLVIIFLGHPLVKES
ncbi:MAG TPA: hypothetical protein VK666_29855 [Chryseolinea sp.]|nr:hypothetical protein [Chryseolinea sp.]